MPSINLDATFELRNLDEIAVFHHGTTISENNDSKAGVYTVIGKINPFTINAGNYKFNLIFGLNQRIVLFSKEDVVQFEIMNEAAGNNSNILPGVLRINIPYNIKYSNSIKSVSTPA